MAVAGKVAITLATDNDGKWSANVSYERLVAVAHNNNMYISRKPSIGVEPPNNEFWFSALEGYSGDELTDILSGKKQVGNAKTLDGNGASYFAKDSDLVVERERISNLARLNEGSTTGDWELADIRVGADGKTYTNAGDAVRGQVANLKSDLDKIKSSMKSGEQFVYKANRQYGHYYRIGATSDSMMKVDCATTDYCVHPAITLTAGTYYIDTTALANGFTLIKNIGSGNYITLSDLHSQTWGEPYSLTIDYDFELYITETSKGDTGIFGYTMMSKTPLPNEYVEGYYSSTTEQTKEKTIFECGEGKEFTTLRSAISQAIQTNGSKVIVYPGEYDLAKEFAEEITNMTTNSVGIYLGNDVEVVFLAGSYVKAIFDGSNANVYAYFQPFYSGGNDSFTLNGLNIEAQNCRYCVHDEHTGVGTYHHRYINCVMKYTNTRESANYTQCIGGGLGEHGYIDVIGGKYNSINNATNGEHGNEIITLSYHNGSSATCDSKIFVKDVWLSGRLQFGSYGASSILSQVCVSGCSMANTIDMRVNPAYGILNYELTEWNNAVRN